MIVCPNCGANLKFNPKSQKMYCGFCESEFDPKQFDIDNDAEEQKPVSEEYGNEEAQKEEGLEDSFDATVFTCPQCGGEIMSVDENTVAAFCSFCGASTILSARLVKGKRPEYIIPFEKTKEDCKGAYRKVISRALFLPKEYKSEEYIDGFRGIYMPYWAYDVMQSGQVNLYGERSHRSGDYILTDHYSLTGNIDAQYKGLSYDAASSFSDVISEALGPFDISKRVPFETSYMSGFYADIADVDKGVYSGDAAAFCYEESLSRITAETPEFRKYKVKEGGERGKSYPGRAFSSKTVGWHESLYPVWFLSYRNGDRVTYATVNGQTGKVVADLPVDIKKYLIASGVMAVIIFVLLNTFLVLKPSNLLLIAVFLTAIVLMINLSQWKSIGNIEKGVGDKGLQYINRKKTSAKGGKKNNNTPESVTESDAVREYKGTAASVAGIISVVISLIMIFFLKTVSDVPYYLLTIADAVIFGILFRYTLLYYNLIATRKLPQFNRQGGDDRA
ncbi:MAG: hypothetical protein K6E98_07975 [Lachnospiraceae bacterium]|nr:hypothetical protein [Lachnospiraceae bacterium]